ncbi:hypothetical protein PybrP1_005640 [[Pythium] brassicae (nom. inval.)]|nr:hypothetical protein PybrP1_005640 [[Pythium] brassicae (nom. inval.)]
MGKSTSYNAVGPIGSFVISSSLVPQSTKLDVIGLAMVVVVYGVDGALSPIYIPCSLELLGSLALLVVK